jgi:hypothetical protein
MGKLFHMLDAMKADQDNQQRLVEFSKEVAPLFEKHGIKFGIISAVVRTKVGDNAYRAATAAASHGLRSLTHSDFQQAADGMAFAIDKLLHDCHDSCSDGCPDGSHDDDTERDDSTPLH